MTEKRLALLKRVMKSLRKNIISNIFAGAENSRELIEYDFSRVSILMPRSHRLGEYKSRHRLYDRFLPHLAKYLPSGAAVVDVGANVGDTLAAMYCENPTLDFICIEPDDEFFSLLEANAKRIRDLDPAASIASIKMLVGASKEAVVLKGSGGTKTAVSFDEGGTAMTRRALDDLPEPIREKEICLIKSDVDGYDYDVIESGFELINRHRPILFFECQFDHEFQKESYERLINSLFAMGYDSAVVFDNFGEVMIRTERVADIVQLFGYLWRQNSGRTSRAMYYYDILFSAPRHSALVTQCIADYLAL